MTHNQKNSVLKTYYNFVLSHGRFARFLKNLLVCDFLFFYFLIEIIKCIFKMFIRKSFKFIFNI